jgi:hypothetical protein
MQDRIPQGRAEMKRSVLLGLTVLTVASAAAAGPSPLAEPTVRVYVGAGRPGGACVTSAVRDSATDVIRSLDEHALIELVSRTDEADVQVWITDRFERPTRRYVMIGGGATPPIPVRIRERVVVGSIVASGSVLEMSGVDRGRWSSAARKLTSELASWIQEHRNTLLGTKPSTPDEPN